MNDLLFIIEKAEEGGYNTRAVTESIYTHGDTLEELMFNIADAIRCHFDGQNYPTFKTHFK